MSQKPKVKALNLKNISLLAVSVFFLSCGPKELAKIDSGSPCPAIIEGYFHYEGNWFGEKPLLTTRGVGRNKEFRTGKIIEITDEGVVFDQDRVSPVYNPEPRLFLNREIHSLVDNNGEIIIGEFPNRQIRTEYLDLVIRRDVPDADLEIVRLRPNELFGYCITPDTYTLVNINWKRVNGDIDGTAFSPVGRFEVRDNEVNYLGWLSLGGSPLENSNTLSLPLRIVHRAQGSALASQFGLVGALLYEAGVSAEGVIGVLDLHLYHSEDFKPQGEMEITNMNVQQNF